MTRIKRMLIALIAAVTVIFGVSTIAPQPVQAAYCTAGPVGNNGGFARCSDLGWGQSYRVKLTCVGPWGAYTRVGSWTTSPYNTYAYCNSGDVRSGSVVWQLT